MNIDRGSVAPASLTYDLGALPRLPCGAANPGRKEEWHEQLHDGTAPHHQLFPSEDAEDQVPTFVDRQVHVVDEKHVWDRAGCVLRLAEERAALITRMRHRPHAYVAQERFTLSHAPTMRPSGR